MKTLSRTIASIALLTGAATTYADLSANAGFVSDYYFRGANLGDAGVYAGVDYTQSGFYAGIWAIDDSDGGNDGLEVDFYAGYGLNVSGFDLGFGFTRYEYTYSSDFEQEFNFNLGYATNIGTFGAELALGEDDDDGAPDTDYSFIGLSWSGEVFGAAYGHFDNDDTNASYDYFEVSASGTIAELDVSLTLGKATNLDNLPGADNDGYLFVDVSKSFDL